MIHIYYSIYLYLLYRKIDALKKQLDERDMKMTWNLLFMISYSWLCQLCLIIIVKSVTRKSGYVVDEPAWQTLGRAMYWTQFGANAFIYAFRTPDIRKCYIDLVRRPYELLTETTSNTKGTG